MLKSAEPEPSSKKVSPSTNTQFHKLSQRLLPLQGQGDLRSLMGEEGAPAKPAKAIAWCKRRESLF